MYKIATLNKISPVGLDCLSNRYQVTENLEEATGIVVRSAPMLEMDFPPSLLAIARAGAGYNNIPVERCAKEGIVVFNTPGANANAVKELVLGGMMLSARNIPAAMQWVETLEKDVKKQVEKGKSQFVGEELKGKSIGIIGLGAIGVMVANAAHKLGMKVLGYDPYITLKSAHQLSDAISVVSDIELLLSQCDYISLHIPVMEETKGFFHRERFSQMKDQAVLLNFARDTLVNDEDLLFALSTGKLKHYVTDFPNDAVIGHSGVIAIPHLGASTGEAEDNCAVMAVNQMMDYIENGNITNSVNYPDCQCGPAKLDLGDRICLMNENIPSVLGSITSTMSEWGINIRDLTNKSSGEFAYTVVDIDAQLSQEQLHILDSIEGIISTRILTQEG